MTDPWPLVGLAGGALLAGMLGTGAPRAAPRRLVKENRSGRAVPVVLGICLVSAFLLVVPVIAGTTRAELGWVGLVELAAVLGLAVVGLLDDLFGEAPRGFRGHLGALRRVRVTTGTVKLIAGLGAALALALAMGGQPIRAVGATVLVAAATNLWNALDVVPGRALKWAILALASVLAAGWTGPAAVPAGTALGAAVGSLPHDLGERAMLGDCGSNPLGFLCGAGLAVVLPTAGLLVAAGTALLLQVAAETVTISRLIDAVPPVRWFDRLGRRAEAGAPKAG